MNLFLEIFEKYGWLGILGIIICILLYISSKYFIKRIGGDVSKGLEKVGENLTNQISKQNDKLVETIVDQQTKLVNYLINKEDNDIKNHNYMLNERIELSEEINSSLKDIMNIHNAQRAFILEFHNSFKNLSGIPFAKYSCTYEWFAKGYNEIGSKCISLPFSNLSRIVSDILKTPNHQIVYTDMEKMEEENPSLFSIFKDENTKSFIYTAMYDRNNILIGLLALEYNKLLKEKDINLAELKIQTAELTSLLNIRYKKYEHVKKES